MNYGQIIYDVLNATTALPIAPLNMAQGVEAPYVVYAVNYIDPQGIKYKTEGLDVVSFSVAVYDQDYEAAQIEADKIRVAFSGLWTNVVQNAWVQSQAHAYIQEVDVNVVVLEIVMRVFYQKYTAGGIGVMEIGNTFIVG
jgi:hypothetical protein